MGRTFESIEPQLRDWIFSQSMYFVGSAPLSADGHINISPKGVMDTFRILDDRTVAYIDLVGSGIETLAHLRENGRVVVMFCAFAGAPKIVRLHGRGRAIPEGEPGFDEVIAQFSLDSELRPLVRSVVLVDVERISDSCGFGVPRMELVAERDQMQRWAAQKQAANGEDWKHQYMSEKNVRSVDALPGLNLVADQAD